jgi:LemA protein
MSGFMNILFGLIFVALLASGLFDVINWSINFVALGILTVVWLAATYNNFVRLVNRAKEAWADIDVQLKRRYDLIPNLVETVKGYASHERETFDAVIQARNNATQVHIDPANIDAVAVSKMSSAETGLSGALGKLFALSEAYPDLKANTNFLELQRELSDTENKIQAARRFYNTNVRDLNIGIESFPANIIAKMFNFAKMSLFEVETAVEREPVNVSF